ncbi:probable disease resistance protein At4g27220 isoform X2 [Mangifera indica]|uniref:probable disease resistance protein At4g27220 isoform X2 n=1 Tax=Mangifera indica TaxID=29780 RepID=UPI001CF97424|nr:probable disease resistance protein At4g27220 isoform X2 [Mangifera indica]
MGTELGTAVVSGVASKVAESMFGQIRQEISYVFKHKSYIEDLKKQVENLACARERVEHSIDYAKKQGEETEKDVEQWLIKVNEFSERIEKSIIENEEKEKKRCFKGLFPNLMACYLFNKKAVKATKDVVDLIAKGNFSRVSYRLQGMNSVYVRGYEAFDSRMPIMEEILEALKDADVNMIGVYGMAGVGKTTLVKKVALQAKEHKLFDVVIMVEVTESPDPKKIQGEIADQLGLVFQEESESGRAGRLHSRLKKEKGRVLVILDNVWAKLDLDAIGIPFGYDERGGAYQKEQWKGVNEDLESSHKNEEWKGVNGDQRRCKILLTSRSCDVLCNEMDTQRKILVETLTNKEAMNLFERIVGLSTEISDFHSISVEIIKKCAGLPLAIITIANALKNKSLFVWKDALDQLRRSNPRCVPNMDETLYSTIELSYKLLRSDAAKSLFLLCGLCMVGNRVHVHDLLGYSIGSGLFGDFDTLEKARNRFHTLIDYLKTSCLLDSDSTDWIKMHDITFAVAVSIASSQKLMFNIPNVTGLKELLEENIPRDSIAISLLYRDIYELPERLECPKLELFLLFMKDHSLQIPELFFEGMKKLKVLDLTGVCLLSLPSSLSCLTNLRTLFLDNCLLIDVSIIAELKKLEILSFLNSSLEKLPAEIGQLTRLRVLDLSNCSKLKVITPNVIASLSRLEELYMGNSFVQWEVKGLNNPGRSNASLDELKHLSHLTNLYIHILDAQTVPWDIFSEKLKCYKIFMGEKWSWPGKYETSRTFKLKLNNCNYLGPGFRTLLKTTEDLYLDEMSGVRNVLYELDRDGFPQLKHLHVQNCPKILHIIHPIEWNSACINAFPILETLFLHNLISLERICHGQLMVESFSRLKTIKVRECNRLKHIFSFSMVKNLQQLQEIEVIDCKNLKEILSEESEDHVEQNQRNSKIEFTQLQSLKLQLLPQLRSFGFNLKTSLISQTSFASCKGSEEIIPEDFMALFSEKVMLPSLENLTLSTVNIKNIWLNQLLLFSSCVQTLKSLIVEGCNSLKFLFSTSMAKYLMQLHNLEIRNCMSMEAVIKTEGLGREEDITKITFPKLFYLELKDLPKCMRFGAGEFLEFPSLEALHIQSCPNLKTFFSSSPFVDLSENRPTDMHPLFDEKVAFPNLETMILSHLDNLQMIWYKQLHGDSFCKLKVVRVEFCETLTTLVPSYTLSRLSSVEYLKITNCASVEQVFEVQGFNIVSPLQLKQLLIHQLPKLRLIWHKNPQQLLSFQNLETLSVVECWSLKSLFPVSVASTLMQLKHLEITSCGLEEIVVEEKVASVPRFVFPQLTFLLLENLPKLKSFFPGLHTVDWPMLKSLLVFHCHKMQIFASNGKSQPQIPIHQPLFLPEKIIPNLERMSLSSCDIKLMSLGHFPVKMFPKVKVLDVVCFHEESAEFPFDFLQKFYSLEKLILYNSNFEELLPYEGVNKEKHDMEFMPVRSLRLDLLPHLRQIWKLNSAVVTFVDHNLQSLEVWRCHHLTCLLPCSGSLKNLTTLDVWCCNGLANILACSAAKTLVQLTTLRIRECNLVTEIIANEVGNTEDEIVFCQLKILELSCLPRLSCFCSADYAFQFPCLEEVIMKQCPELKTFSERVVSTPRLKRVQLIKQTDQGYFWKDDLNSTIQHLFTDMVQIRNLEYLELSEFPLERKMEWPTSS